MSQFINLPKAAAMTKRFRDNKEAILATAYRNKNVLPLSETFERQAIDMLLAQPGAAFLRVYYGMDEDLKLHAILVAANSQDEDILPVAQNENGENGSVVEDANRCPPLCPPESPLNQS